MTYDFKKLLKEHSAMKDNTLIYEIPTKPTRIWDLVVPIVYTNEGKTIDAYISCDIGDSYHYNELCHVLKCATSDNIIHIHINTHGGVVDSALMIADAITKSKASVCAHLSGTVASSGTMIALACNEFVVSPQLAFMIHNYSGGMAGKGHELKARQNFMDHHLNGVFTTFYLGFLTQKEIADVIDGTDIWMGAEEVLKRIEARCRLRKPH